MGPASRVSELEVVTDKRVRDVVGDRIWLITGEGKPRTYYLVSVFTVEKVEDASSSGFQTRLRGSNGQLFRPMINLSVEDWMPDLVRCLGNFAFGFQRISDDRFVNHLERVVAPSGVGTH
jgi:hypothetical protein